jgi:hypothetical protein
MVRNMIRNIILNTGNFSPYCALCNCTLTRWTIGASSRAEPFFRRSEGSPLHRAGPFVPNCNHHNFSYCAFSKNAFTVNSDPAATVKSRFHGANPGSKIATACAPMPTLKTEGVLPTYFPSTVISAPDGVELKLHFTLASET